MAIWIFHAFHVKKKIFWNLLYTKYSTTDFYENKFNDKEINTWGELIFDATVTFVQRYDSKA